MKVKSYRFDDEVIDGYKMFRLRAMQLSAMLVQGSVAKLQVLTQGVEP